MNTRLFARACAPVLILSWSILAAPAEVVVCRHNHFAAAPNGGSPHHYAPDRRVDILHFALDVTPDFQHRTVSGKATMQFKPVAQPLSELRLDAVKLTVHSVSSTRPIAGYYADDEAVTIAFEEPIAADQEASVSVSYSAEPKNGLYFRTPAMGYKPEDMHLWTQGEPHEAQHWFPCYDYPNEKFTSEVTCRVPADMVVLSNGRKVSEERDADSNLVAVRWLQDKPHANYLISLLAGYFKGIEDTYKDLPIGFFTPASQVAEAANSFEDTKDMLAFFEEEIGVPYPWAKYYQVCVDDFSWGGMENTSITTLTDRTLHRKETENLRNSQGLVAHELAHQWFGDLTTCKDWSHLWLNEGFATYYDALYQGHKNGRDAFLYDLYNNANTVLRQSNDTTPMVRRDYHQPEDQFNYLAYPKGSWILHMLRSQLGADLYRQCIKTYVERHQFTSVVTEDLNSVIEELSGRSFDQFFDQYVYHAHHPELAISYNWDPKTKLAKLNIRQVQKLGPTVLLFRVPLTVRFKTADSVVDRTITVSQDAEDFHFPLDQAPDLVRIDPEFTLLAKIDFHPPRAMVNVQIKDQSDMIGRLLAVDELKSKRDNDARTQLRATLNSDSFYAVRNAASRALRELHTDEALDALIASVAQEDARVRRQVLGDIADFYHPKALAALQAALETEKNPDIQAVLIAGLGAYSEPEIRDTLVARLQTESYRNRIADSAIRAMRAQSDPFYIDSLLQTLTGQEAKFTSGGFASALGALAYLARDEEDKTAVRKLLDSHLRHPKRSVQLAAINALGALGDEQAIEPLRSFAEAMEDSPERGAAERAIGKLREQRPASTELGRLRNEVTSLQKENRELRDQFDQLEQRFEAAFPAPLKKNQPKPKR